MTDQSKKPREFWIEIDINGHDYVLTEPPEHDINFKLEDMIHVIEFSAHEAVIKELEELREKFEKHKHIAFIGTDGCKKCETGRVTLFVADEYCIECRAKYSGQEKAVSGE